MDVDRLVQYSWVSNSFMYNLLQSLNLGNKVFVL